MHLVAVTGRLNLLGEVGKASGRNKNKAGKCWTNRSGCRVGHLYSVVIKYGTETTSGRAVTNMAWSWKADCGDQNIKDRHTDTGTEKLRLSGLCSS